MGPLGAVYWPLALMTRLLWLRRGQQPGGRRPHLPDRSQTTAITAWETMLLITAALHSCLLAARWAVMPFSQRLLLLFILLQLVLLQLAATLAPGQVHRQCFVCCT